MRSTLINVIVALSLSAFSVGAFSVSKPAMAAETSRAEAGLCARNPEEFGPCPKAKPKVRVNRKRKGDRLPLPPQE